jgi:hypothetical protein
MPSSKPSRSQRTLDDFRALVLSVRTRGGHITVDPQRRETQAALETFRRSAPRNVHGAATRSVSLSGYDIADVRLLFGKGRA